MHALLMETKHMIKEGEVKDKNRLLQLQLQPLLLLVVLLLLLLLPLLLLLLLLQQQQQHQAFLPGAETDREPRRHRQQIHA